jgi:iron complex outermembrane receptor protein
VTVNYYGYAADFTSITAFQYWRSKDATDMDATPADLIRRTIAEDQRSFTQEFRLSSPQNKPVGLSRDLKLSWLVGAFFFKSGYDQRAFSDYLPGAVAALGLPFPFTQFENADLDDYGAAVFGQSTLSLFDKLDLTLGLRFDYESKNARLASFSSVPLMPATSQDADADFSRFLPRLGAAYHWTADLMTYATAAEGFKAGGFNTNAPAGKVPYDPETSWTYEIGLKQSFFKNRLIVNADAFYIEWNDLQLDVPTGAPGVFFLDNVGQATSKGLELEATVRPLDALELFTGLGYVNAEFARYTLPSGQRADGNDLPFAPHVTWNGGAEYSIRIADDLRLYARGEVVTIARYFYDASNTQGDGYSLASFRLGIGRKHWRLEGWVRNAFDEKYVPLALPFPLAPSGYIGESGEPRVYGVTLSMEF